MKRLLFALIGLAILAVAEGSVRYLITRASADGKTYFYEGGSDGPEQLVGILDPSISPRPMYAWFTYNPNDNDGRTAQAVNLDAHISAGKAALSWLRGAIDGFANLTVADWLAPTGTRRFGQFSGEGQDQYVSGIVFNFTGRPNGGQMITDTAEITDKRHQVIGELTPQHIKLYDTFSFWGRVRDAIFGADVYGTTAAGLYWAQLNGTSQDVKRRMDVR